jgi:hypothetical protein
MLLQEAVSNTLRDTHDALCAMIGPGTPSALHLWRKLSALRRRLLCDPPAGKTETVERLRAIHNECSGDLTRFRPAVRQALNIAEQLDWQGRGNAHGWHWGRGPRSAVAPHALTRRVHRHRVHPHLHH